MPKFIKVIHLSLHEVVCTINVNKIIRYGEYQGVVSLLLCETTGNDGATFEMKVKETVEELDGLLGVA